MPALILRECQILHIPKCGGKWVQQAFNAGGVRYTEWHVAHETCPEKDKPAVAFVRHPLTWWQSLWRYRMKRGWPGGEKPFRVAGEAFDLEPLFARTFAAFIYNVLYECPGYCSRLFERFTGSRLEPIEFVGKQESLAEDLVRALRMFGVEHDAARILNTPAYHVTDKGFAAYYTLELAAAMCEAEREAIGRYGYEGIFTGEERCSEAGGALDARGVQSNVRQEDAARRR